MATTITLLTRSDCKLCAQAKAVLAKVAYDHALVVEEVDVTSPAGAAQAAQAGMLFPPGVLLDGEPFTYGRLSERKLRRELTRRAAQATPTVPGT
ncbi:MAG: glutaredoxin family protein [Acidimicrobiales bacterium]